jgi:hypothetical protein
MLWLQSTITPPTAVRDDLVKGIAAGVLGLVGSLASLLFAWLKERDVLAKRAAAIETAVNRLAFWDMWLKNVVLLHADSELADRQSEAKRQLDALANEVDELYSLKRVNGKRHDLIAAFDAKKARISPIGRALLLYRPARPRAWIPRAFFYGFLIVGPLQCATVVYQYLNEPSLKYFKERAGRLQGPHMTDYERGQIASDNEAIRGAQKEYLQIFTTVLIGTICLPLIFRKASVLLERPRSPESLPDLHS